MALLFGANDRDRLSTRNMLAPNRRCVNELIVKPALRSDADFTRTEPASCRMLRCSKRSEENRRDLEILRFAQDDVTDSR